MKRATFNILFFIKRTKLLRNGEAPICMRITINKQSSDTSLKRSIRPELWDTTRNKCKGQSDQAKAINEYIESVRGQIYTHQQTMQERGKDFDAKTITNAFLGLGEKKWKLIELFDDHNKNMKELIGSEYSPLTLQRYEAAHKHLSDFLLLHYNIEDLFLNEINHSFITRFEHYLKSEKSCQHNTAMKHMKALKKIINFAIANEYIKKDPFVSYTISTREVKRDMLNQAELNRLANKDISIARLDVIRDLFLFQCYTGLAFADLSQLTKNDVQFGIDGHKWLFIQRQKTSTECRIPLFPITENILKKYQGNPECQIKNTLLPVPSNQKMNAYLKELATICGIDKNLHSHLARHTYATTVTLENNIPIETVSKLLGHKKIQTTQIYAKVLDTKVSKDMEGLRAKFG
ncbi:MAG: site-specific integrase [Bacteroidetes bacterium]|nr:site-specific integrase [Bacteroidota bacterium]